MGAYAPEKDVEVTQGRQGCNSIASPVASHGTCADICGAVKREAGKGILLAGWEDQLEAVFVVVGGFHLDAVESLPL